MDVLAKHRTQTNPNTSEQIFDCTGWSTARILGFKWNNSSMIFHGCSMRL